MGTALKWGLLCGLLITQYLYVSLQFDAGSIRDREGLRWLSSFGLLVPLLVAVSTAAWLLIQRHTTAELSNMLAHHRAVRWRYLGGQLLAYGVFVYLCGSVFNKSNNRSAAIDAGLIAAWFAAGLATFALWLLAALPLRTVLRSLRTASRPLLMALVAGSMAWGLGLLTMEYLWQPLAHLTLRLVVVLLRVVAPVVVVDMPVAVVGVPGFVVQIAPACSGYEGIGLVVAFLGLFLVAERSSIRFTRAIWLLPWAVGVVYLANGCRIATLIMVGGLGFPNLAVGGLHSKAGWVLVCAISLTFASLAQRVPWFSREAQLPRAPVPGLPNLTAVYLTPMLTMVAARMVTEMLVAGFNPFYAVAPILATLALLRSRASLPSMKPAAPLVAGLVGLAVFVMWMVSVRVSAGVQPNESTLEAAVRNLPAPWSLLWVAGRTLGSIVVVPVVEELSFRGYLLRRLVSRDFQSVPFAKFTWPSFLASSLAFGMLHQRWVEATLAGMAFAAILHRRGSLGDAIVAHAVTNTAIAIAVVAGGDWSLWE
ncbi:MAG: exosortase E/protease, VPEID-CTERM system [Myxococcales bacterium]|nr:exosortase E/protease, VPEID-CTERM system [Myxococcales bacterium]